MKIIKVTKCNECPFCIIRLFDFNYCRRLHSNIGGNGSEIDHKCPLENGDYIEKSD